MNEVVDCQPAQQCNECEMVLDVIARDGSRTRFAQPFSLCYLFRHELDHLLARPGFTPVAFHGDYDRSPFGDESPPLIAVASPS